MAVRCARCGFCSELEEPFLEVRSSFSRRRRRLCPRCVHQRRVSEARGSYRWLLAVLALCVGVGTLRPQWPIAEIAVDLAAFLVAWLPAMLLHEAGHAVAGRLLGMRALGIVIGFGRRLWRGRVFGMPVTWHAVPSYALTRGALPSADGARWRMALFASAGPAVNALLAALAWDARVALAQAGVGDALAGGWIAAHVFCAVGNAIPFRHATPYGTMASDGMLVWQALRAQPETVQEWLSAGFVLEAIVAREDGRPEEALARLREGLTVHPGHAGITSLLGVLLLETGAGEAAREVFLRELSAQHPPLERAIALSNVAWCDFVSGREERLDEALQCSQEAFEQLGWMPAIQSTRAAVLVWADRAEEALPLAVASFDAAEAPADRASVACVLAMAHASLGRRDDAKRALEQARALDPDCLLLARAAVVVA